MGMASDYAESEPKRAEVDALPGATLLEFGSPWCGWCRRAQPLIAEALAAHPDVRHIKVADASGRRLGRSFGVKLWPTFVFLRGGSSDSVRVTATGEGGLDLTLEQIDRTEAPLFARNLTAANGAESFARVVGADGFIAMRVTAAGGAAGTFDLDAEVVDLAESAGTSAPAVEIPDDDPDGVDDVIALGDACTVAGVTVDVDITHPFRGDVALTLTSPTGTSILLKDSDLDAADDVVGQFPTTLTPAESLDTFLAEDAAGEWTLNASDSAFLDAGTLNTWGLTVSCM